MNFRFYPKCSLRFDEKMKFLESITDKIIFVSYSLCGQFIPQSIVIVDSWKKIFNS